MSTLYEELKRRKKSKTDVLPPDAPASGEAAPAAEPVPAEELAKLPEDAQKIVRDYEGEAGFVQYSGTYTKATVTRVVKLGDFNMIHVGLEMALTDVKDPKAALRDMARELDDFAEEYRQEKKV